MAHKKTRFVVLVDGVPHELFSVREMPNSKDLTINLKRPYQIGNMPAPGEASEFVDAVAHRFSVHNSPSSEGFTLTQWVDAGSHSLKTAALILPSEGRFIWPLYAMRSPRMADDYVLQANARDTIVHLGSHDPALTTLVYFVTVANKAATGQINAQMPQSLRVKEFTSFDLLVFHTFLLAPSREGQLIAFATSGSGAPAQSLGPESLERYFRQMRGVLALGHLDHWQRAREAAGLSTSEKEAAEMFLAVSAWSPDPIENSNQADG